MGLLNSLTARLRGDDTPEDTTPEKPVKTPQLPAQGFPASESAFSGLNLNGDFKPKNPKPFTSSVDIAARLDGHDDFPEPGAITHPSTRATLAEFKTALGHYGLVELGAHWLADFIRDPSRESDHGLHKVYDQEVGDTLIQLPNGILAAIDLDGLAAYDLDDEHAVGWLCTYIEADVWESGEDGCRYTLGETELAAESRQFVYEKFWTVQQELPASLVADLAIGGPTDFYEREHAWPHHPLADGTWAPLPYVATFTHGYKAYDFFYDRLGLMLDGEFGDPKDHSYMGAYAILQRDAAEHALPAWVRLLPLANPAAQPLADSERHVNPLGLPLGPQWIQYSQVPAAPYNHFVVEIPSVGDIMFGDMGSIYIFTDNQGGFKPVWQTY